MRAASSSYSSMMTSSLQQSGYSIYSRHPSNMGSPVFLGLSYPTLMKNPRNGCEQADSTNDRGILQDLGSTGLNAAPGTCYCESAYWRSLMYLFVRSSRTVAKIRISFDAR